MEKINAHSSTTLLCKKTCVLFCCVLLRHLPIKSAQYVYHRAIHRTSLSYLTHQILSFSRMQELSG